MEKEVNHEPYSLDWNFTPVWNVALEAGREERKPEVRTRIFASELGKAPIDVYLKCKGTPLTNPPNPRSLRKFEAGNFFEYFVGLILKRAGILESGQERVTHQYDGLCEVTGKIDYMAGGKPDPEKFRAELEAMELPEMFYRGFNAVIDHLTTTYPNGLGSKPVEIKSLSSFMYEAVEKSGKALKIHRLQEFHYLKSKGIAQGMVVYICRDDMRMIEIPVYNNEENEAEYKAEIAKLSHYILNDIMPEKEKPLIWDEDICKFSKNFNVAYSGYLTMLYGFENQKEFDDKYKPVQDRWNRVIKRIKNGDKMTAKNLEAIKEMEEAGFNPQEFAEKMVDTGLEEEVVE